MFLNRHRLTAKADPYTPKRNPITARLYRYFWDKLHQGNDPKFVFVATTGRSGTEFLQKIFASLPGCSSHHEPWPIMADDVLKSWNDGEEWLARRTYWVQKAVSIRRLTGDNDLYVETNHLFAKSFAPYAIQDFGLRLRIIHLRRDPVSVARSMVALAAVPGTVHGNDWYLDYRAPRNLIKIGDLLGTGGELDDDFYRCLWYWYETEARIQVLKTRFPQIPWFMLDWEGEIPLADVAELIRGLGKEPDMKSLESQVKKKVNQQVSLKEGPTLARRALDDMHRRFQDALRESGFLPIIRS